MAVGKCPGSDVRILLQRALVRTSEPKGHDGERSKLSILDRGQRGTRLGDRCSHVASGDARNGLRSVSIWHMGHVEPESLLQEFRREVRCTADPRRAIAELSRPLLRVCDNCRRAPAYSRRGRSRPGQVRTAPDGTTTFPPSPAGSICRSSSQEAAITAEAQSFVAEGFGQAAFFSRSCFHCPRAARLFIIARWEKARWAAAMFSGLPDQAFCGAACRARP
jgi:hypothetical protein